MNNGKVSIIIPVFNSESYLHSTLDSIVNQSYDNWECICVDDHSTDDSFSILKEYSSRDARFKIHQRPNNLRKGGNSCRNYGFSLAEGEYIQWFDSDDLMDITMLDKKVSSIVGLNYVICRTAYFTDDVANITPYEQCLNTTNLLVDYLTYKTKFFTPGPLFRKVFLDGFELFDIELQRHQEKEFFFRIILCDSNFAIVNEALIYRRLHENQLSTKINKSSSKIKLEFIASKKIFHYYLKHIDKEEAVNKYFKGLFFKYSHRLVRQNQISLGFSAMVCWVRSLSF